MRLLGVRIKWRETSLHRELEEFVQIPNSRVAHQNKVNQVRLLVETFGYFSESTVKLGYNELGC
jgi:hypothetical protein